MTIPFVAKSFDNWDGQKHHCPGNLLHAWSIPVTTIIDLVLSIDLDTS